MFILFSDFLMFDQIFPSPQVKGSVIISNKYGKYKLPYEFLNDLRLRIPTAFSPLGGAFVPAQEKKRLRILGS